MQLYKELNTISHCKNAQRCAKIVWQVKINIIHAVTLMFIPGYEKQDSGHSAQLDLTNLDLSLLKL